MSLLDERLGFGDWFKDLSPSQKSSVVVAPADTAKQILIFVPNPSGGQRCLCYDYQYDFTSEFTDYGGTATYACMFRDDDESKVWVFGVGRYPGTGTDGSEAYTEMWLNDGSDRVKTIESLVVDVGPRSGSFEVQIESAHHGDPDDDASPVENRTETTTFAGSNPGRFKVTKAEGMRGRMFRIRVTMPSGECSLQRVHIDYHFDDGGTGGSA